MAADRVGIYNRAMNGLGRLPPFSPVLMRLVATLGYEDVSFSEVASLIEGDTVLAGHVLRAVNSALYGFSGTVSSIRHAVSLMGIVKLRNTTLSLSVARLWNGLRMPASFSMARFDQHSAATAVLADVLAQRLPCSFGEGAFTAGLLHDVGKLLIAVALPVEFEAIAREGGSREAERGTLGFDHADLSGSILSRWNLPAPIQEAVEHHHAPRGPAGETHRLEEILAAADATVLNLDLGLRPAAVAANPGEPLEAFGLAPDAVLEDFRTEFDSIRHLF